MEFARVSDLRFQQREREEVQMKKDLEDPDWKKKYLEKVNNEMKLSKLRELLGVTAASTTMEVKTVRVYTRTCV